MKADGKMELGAYASVAFGLAVAGYGWYLQGQGMRGLIPSLGIGAGVGGVLAGIQILRRLDPERVRAPIWLRGVVVIAALAVGIAALYWLMPAPGRVALRDRDIEGMTIGWPDGDVQPSALPTSLVVGIGKETMVGVVWQLGSFDEPTALALATSSANQVGRLPVPLGGEHFVVGSGIPNRSFRIDASLGTMWQTVFACGPRLFAVFSGGPGTPELQRRMLATVRCRPNQAVPGLPAIVDLPPPWELGESEAMARTYSNGDEELIVAMMDPVPDALLQGVAERASKQLGGPAQLGARRDVAGPDGTRAVWSGTVTLQVALPFQLAIWTCPGRAAALQVIHAGGDERSAAEALGHVRCARPDEPLPSPPVAH